MKKQYKIQLPKGKKVTMTNVDFEDGVMTVNVEFENREEKKYEPKDGDFVYVKAGYEYIAIFKKEVGEDMYVYANWNMSFSVSKIIIDDSRPLCCIHDIKEIRPATEREKKILIDQLAEIGKRWNEKEKRIEDIEYIPDDGDIVHILYGDTHEEIAIFYYRVQYDVSLPYYIVVGKEEDLLGHGCAYMLSKEEAGYKDIDESLRICKIMPATKKEKDMMLNHLASIGKRWNPETKRIEDVRWRAGMNKPYYYIIGFDNIVGTTDARLACDENRYATNNYFRTREASEKVAEQIRELFKNSKPE